MKNTRALAASIIGDLVFKYQSLSDCLPTRIEVLKDPRDQAFVRAICYGVARRYYYLEAILSCLLDKPLDEIDKEIYCLLLVGLFQLSEMRMPSYAAVDDTVSACDVLNKAWAKGLVNAVLRNFLRKEKEFPMLFENHIDVRYAHPEWLVGMIQKAWPEDLENILEANNGHPPFSLRVNLRKISREAYLEKLHQHNIVAAIIPETETGIQLSEAESVKNLPGFDQGEVSVQDGAAQLSADLMELSPGLRVLDACAAPGGKTAHILESAEALSLLAIDKDRGRIQMIEENLSRLQLTASCLCRDAGKPSTWYDGLGFDRILLDAPCSASGVIRRHPDIKLLRRPEDVQNLVEEQYRLLTALWPCLKIGGLLLYATCSIFPRENVGVLSRFLNERPDAREEKIETTWGRPLEIGRQILPGMHNMDGFYYAKLRKIS